MAKNRRGFTLIELVVVVMIMGILASLAMPYYYKTMETSKANDSLAIGHLLGNANRMYLLDNPPPQVSPNPPSPISGQITNGCNGLTCGAATGGCRLVACSYVAQQDWDNGSYNFYVCDGGNGGGCCGNSATGATGVACASRKAGASSPYSGWGYRFFNDGSCKEFGTNAPSCPKF